MRRLLSVKSLELTISLAIISLLGGVAATCYQAAVISAKTVHAVGGSYIDARRDIVYYRALHGTWPQSNTQTAETGWAHQYPFRENSYIKKTVIENGAIHQYFSDELPGRIISLRPAVPAADDLGPIIWICGSRPTDQWQVFGKDRTNIDEKYIHRHLK